MLRWNKLPEKALSWTSFLQSKKIGSSGGSGYKTLLGASSVKDWNLNVVGYLRKSDSISIHSAWWQSTFHKPIKVDTVKESCASMTKASERGDGPRRKSSKLWNLILKIWPEAAIETNRAAQGALIWIWTLNIKCKIRKEGHIIETTKEEHDTMKTGSETWALWSIKASIMVSTQIKSWN